VVAEETGGSDGRSEVMATVKGLPVGSTATLTATANGTSEFLPFGDNLDACRSVSSTADSTEWACQVTTDPAAVVFHVNTAQGRDVTFVVTPVAPLTDPDPSNNSFGLHWG
jgi:hypothetical protein